MPVRSFESLQQRLQELSTAGDYESARKLAEDNLPRFPKFAHILSLWLVGMSARLHKYPDAMSALERVLDTGFWYDEDMLRRSSALKAVWHRADFQELLTRNRQARECDAIEAHSLMVLHRDQACQPGKPECPLLIALHDNSSTASETLETWKEIASSGWLVAALQSSQAMWKGAYIWNDFDQAAIDLQDHFQVLSARYVIDPTQLILGGTGRGAEMAALLTLRGVLPVRGFIAINPTGPLISRPEKWESILLEPREFNPPGYLLIDSRLEESVQENVRIFTDLLNESGIHAELDDQTSASIKSANPDLNLARAIEFISNS